MTKESYQLYSFEQDVKQTPTPGKSRCYFIVSEENGRCESILSDLSDNLVTYSDTEVQTLFDDLQLSPDKIIFQSLLGEWENNIYSVILIKSQDIANHRWVGLRKKLGVVSDQLFMIAGRALQLCQWHVDHRFCGRCGSATSSDQEDSALVCVSCQLRFYPRISPCMIVAVVRDDKILLAHHRRSNRLVYSTLAGFVEAGETVEDCVVREVYEEVGIRISQPRYLLSEPWPFPSQLMLGFIAEYQSGEIVLDEKEILDAQWFRYDALPETPSNASVAGQLIRFFVEQQKNKGAAR